MSLAPAFDRHPRSFLRSGAVEVADLLSAVERNDSALLKGFALEWERFARFNEKDLARIAEDLFDLLPPKKLGPDTRIIDIGCGSGRWSRILAPRVGHIDAIDPNDAILSAAINNADIPNIRWSKARGEDLPFASASFDIALCIGVLHHMQRPELALQEALRVLRPGGMLYFYIYYALEDRGRLYKGLYRISDAIRRKVHPLPPLVKYWTSQFIAATAYLPLVSLVRLARALGIRGWSHMPLAFYHNKSFRIMRNDALDRFGTSVEKRFTREQIGDLLQKAGFEAVEFSNEPPYWHGLAKKTAP
jgi:ubiquinone/menaquinone biosynthesis C-methylase UbiE